jgi:glycosyltransferase involved in cell wall biosynthesis
MVPVFNTGRFVADTIRSILAQDLRDLELIVIDDGSTDDSPRILRELAATDSRVRLVCRENKGLVATRNEMLQMARGEFLAVNDSDDLSQPDRLSRQVKFLRENPEVVVVGGAFDMIDDAGRYLTTLCPPRDDAAIQKSLLSGHCSICHSCGMMRASAVRQVAGYDSHFTYSHDLELWLRLGEVGRLANLQWPSVVRFRLHENSISETKRHQQRALCREACERAWSRRGLKDVPFEAEQPWRPGKDRGSRHKFALQYGWWAFANGERKTAMYYGKRAIAAQPLNFQGWKLIASAMLKPMPKIDYAAMTASHS